MASSKSLYRPLNSQVKLVWLYGPSGSGKSSLAHKKYPKAFYKEPNCDFKNYSNQDTVVIEDLALNARRPFMTSFIKWLDPQPFQVQLGYKKEFIRPKRLVVCSYNHPCDFKHFKPFMYKLLSNCRIIYCGNASRSPSSSEDENDSDNLPSISPDASPRSDVEDYLLTSPPNKFKPLEYKFHYYTPKNKGVA